MREGMMLVDSIHIVHRDGQGNIIKEWDINNTLFRRMLVKLGLKHNSMTTVGFEATASRLFLDSGDSGGFAKFLDIGIGTGTNAATSNDTQLQTSVKIVAVTPTLATNSSTNDTLQLVHTFSAANDSLSGTSAIDEIGVFNGTVNGTSKMLLRQQYTPADNCNWTAGDTLAVTVKVVIKQGAA